MGSHHFWKVKTPLFCFPFSTYKPYTREQFRMCLVSWACDYMLSLSSLGWKVSKKMSDWTWEISAPDAFFQTKTICLCLQWYEFNSGITEFKWKQDASALPRNNIICIVITLPVAILLLLHRETNNAYFCSQPCETLPQVHRIMLKQAHKKLGEWVLQKS